MNTIIDTINLNVLRFEQLTNTQKQDIINDYRYTLTNDSYWSDSNIEDFTVIAEDKGFSDVKCYFSGFYTQGDGACFDCNNIDIIKLIDTINNPKYNKLKLLVNFLHLKTETNNCATHYSHEKTRYIDILWGSRRYVSPRLHTLILCFVKDVESLMRDLCRELYRKLRNDYQYLTSDEFIADFITGNDFKFVVINNKVIKLND